MACDFNEMVGIKMAWYWYEVKFYIHGLGMISWNGFNIKYEWGFGYKGWHESYVHDKSFFIDWVWLVCVSA